MQDHPLPSQNDYDAQDTTAQLWSLGQLDRLSGSIKLTEAINVQATRFKAMTYIPYVCRTELRLSISDCAALIGNPRNIVRLGVKVQYTVGQANHLANEKRVVRWIEFTPLLIVNGSLGGRQRQSRLGAQHVL